jgi:hypothetical protein
VSFPFPPFPPLPSSHYSIPSRSSSNSKFNKVIHVVKRLRLTWTHSVNFCIVEPSGVKTNFEGHSKAHTAPHPAYQDPSMPARKLEFYVNAGIKAGGGGLLIERSALAETLFMIADRGEKVPLRLPLGATAWKMIKGKVEGFLGELEEVKGISGLGKDF